LLGTGLGLFGFNGLARLIFAFKACSVEGLALQQAEYDLNLVQPGRPRIDPFTLPNGSFFFMPYFFALSISSACSLEQA
jgi:hypothetical protein